MYYVVYGLLYLLSLLPLRVLYLFSDLGYLVIYYIMGYRKDVVANNLKIAFPQKTVEERQDISKRFYRNFTDNFIEALKMMSASKKFINDHFTADYTLFNDLYERGKKVQAHIGHNFNWELGNAALPLNVRHTFLVVYLPLGSKLFDRLFLKIRSRTGAKMLSAANLRKSIIPWRNELFILTLVADQTPPGPRHAYWVNFFNRPTPFVTGPESGIRAADTAIVFSHFTKIKRGFYQGHFQLLTDDARTLEKGELTKKYAQYLEEAMTANPDIWLWSHRRWKFDYKPEHGKIYN